jgi:hypothetical protein
LITRIDEETFKSDEIEDVLFVAHLGGLVE